jgi:hypothetical protein
VVESFTASARRRAAAELVSRPCARRIYPNTAYPPLLVGKDYKNKGGKHIFLIKGGIMVRHKRHSKKKHAHYQRGATFPLRFATGFFHGVGRQGI